MDVELPSGVVIQGVPDGWNKAQLTNYLVAKGKGALLASEADKAMANPTKDMSGVQRFLAGAGKAYADTGRGIRQLTGNLDQQSVDESKRLDEPLMNTGAGMAGNIIGNAALFAPTALVPGANTYTGSAIAGSLAGLLQPVASGESRGMNVATGAGAGVAGQAVGRLLGRAIRPVASELSPEQQALASAARREGIPLSAGDATGSRPLQITESVLENLPLTSASQLAQREAQQRAFTAAALKRAGIQSDSAGAQILGAQKNALGSELGSIAQRNSLDMNPVVGKLGNIVDDASRHLPPDAAAKVSTMADKILEQIDKKGVMSGTNYQGWREPLRNMASKGDETSRYFGQLRRALDDEFKAQLQGSDAQTFTDASRKYANLKTITHAMGGAGNLPAIGQISPAQLSSAIGNAMGREGKALGRGDLNELARIGQTFVKDKIPNSGTAQRQLIQSLLTTGAGSAIGGGAALASGNDPMKGLAIGAGIGASGLAIPKLVQALMNSKAGQAYLTNGIASLSATQRKALTDAVRLGAMGSAPALAPANE
jgi:hypothetical protein